MKISLKVFIYVLLSFSMVLASCCEEKKYKIGVSQCSADDWRSKMNQEMILETNLHDNAEIEIRSADDSNQKQIDDIRYFADHGFDIIIVAPNEAETITPVIDEVIFTPQRDIRSSAPRLIFLKGVRTKNISVFPPFRLSTNRTPT